MTEIEKIELLAPAKNSEIGIAAINHGADAVYIGGPDFGAREKAGNSLNDIEQLCRHAALFNAKVYVTLNTILFNKELEAARKIAFDCWNMGVDALIIQDMALLEMDLPPIPLHASTQCNNMTVEKVKFLQDVGFSQVVLGRELNLDQICEIRKATTVPLEFFVHGSLCVSFNGQCYMSYVLGNRSANRGACAQPCRLPWNLLDEQGNVLVRDRHLLSLKDLDNHTHLEQLIDAGISSFKIEGRMKDADYVKNVTAFYRKQLDAIFARRSDLQAASIGHSAIDFEPDINKSFSRGFTDYFINGRQPNIGSPYTPKSMGEYIGKSSRVSRSDFDIETDKILHNGDGLCFLNADKNLCGLRIETVRNNKRIMPNKMDDMFRGAELYRNFDIEWQRVIERSEPNRKIDIVLSLRENENGFTLMATSNQLTCSLDFEMDKIIATNPEKATENIRRKLSQWGDTHFNVAQVDLQFSRPFLIQASKLGEMKQTMLTNFTAKLIQHHQSERQQRIEPQKDIVILEKNLTYLSNVTNDKSRGFYTRLGVEQIQNGVEIVLPEAPFKVMTTKHCIRYSNGLCPKLTGKPIGTLYIENEKQRFRLEFDCLNCQMEVYRD